MRIETAAECQVLLFKICIYVEVLLRGTTLFIFWRNFDQNSLSISYNYFAEICKMTIFIHFILQ